jgi:probable F420-dependent oxidoreductase
MHLGKIGVWTTSDSMDARALAALAQWVEKAGYAALWVPEATGRNVFVTASWLLANTSSLILASGIANIYARDAVAMVAGREALNEQSGGRFLLGIGVSHAPLVDQARGHVYEKPVQKMRSYLEAMAQVRYVAPPAPERSLTVVGALRSQMMALSRDLADGAHPYNAPPEHTAQSREILGPGKLLCVEQMVLLDTDAAKARAIGRKTLSMYLGLPNYLNHWLALGFTQDDFAAGGSDRLIDAIVAWGDETAVRKRVIDHIAAGADHVCIQPLADVGTSLDRLAPVLLG